MKQNILNPGGSLSVYTTQPQEIVLGPVVFTIFIDDLELDSERLKMYVFIIKFADETKGNQRRRRQKQDTRCTGIPSGNGLRNGT
jgi:hypothetical protein